MLCYDVGEAVGQVEIDKEESFVVGLVRRPLFFAVRHRRDFGIIKAMCKRRKSMIKGKDVYRVPLT